METNIATYPEDDSTIKLGQSKQNELKLEIANSEEKFVTFTFAKEEMDNLIGRMQFQNRVSYIGAELCITAIKNLVKKNDFLQLSLQLSEKLITEEQFDQEIETNPDQYIIKLSNQVEPKDLHIISNIIRKIGKKFTTDEVAELFSFDTRSINEGISSIGENCD